MGADSFVEKYKKSLIIVSSVICLLILIGVVAILINVFIGGGTAFRIQCEPGWTFYAKTASCYKFITKSYYSQSRGYNFTEGEHECSARGAKMATIHNSGEVLVVAEKQSFQTTYLNWTTGAPSDVSRGENCGGMLVDYLDHPRGNGSIDLGSLNNYNCSVKQRGTVCQKPANVTQLTSGSNTTACPNGFAYFNRTNACYVAMTNFFMYVNFSDAEKTCISFYQAHLASIHNKEENDFIIDLTTSGANAPLGMNVGIGVQRNDANSSWYNLDESAMDYTNFSNTSNILGGGNCVQLIEDTSVEIPYLHRWLDFNCSSTVRAFVCKLAAS